MTPTLGFQEALDRLRASGLPALPVVDAGGALVGLLTMDNITDLLLVRGAARAGSRLGSAEPVVAPLDVRQRRRGSTTHAGDPLAAAHPVGEARTQVPHLDRQPHPLGGPVLVRQRPSPPAGSCVPRLERKTFCCLSTVATESTAWSSRAVE